MQMHKDIEKKNKFRQRAEKLGMIVLNGTLSGQEELFLLDNDPFLRKHHLETNTKKDNLRNQLKVIH